MTVENLYLYIVYILENYTVLRWSVGVVIVVTVLPRAIKLLWYLYCTTGCDSEGSDKPLPPGTMGYPLVGETMQLVTKVCHFYVTMTSHFQFKYFYVSVFSWCAYRIEIKDINNQLN